MLIYLLFQHLKILSEDLLNQSGLLRFLLYFIPLNCLDQEFRRSLLLHEKLGMSLMPTMLRLLPCKIPQYQLCIFYPQKTDPCYRCHSRHLTNLTVCFYVMLTNLLLSYLSIDCRLSSIKIWNKNSKGPVVSKKICSFADAVIQSPPLMYHYDNVFSRILVGGHISINRIALLNTEIPDPLSGDRFCQVGVIKTEIS